MRYNLFRHLASNWLIASNFCATVGRGGSVSRLLAVTLIGSLTACSAQPLSERTGETGAEQSATENLSASSHLSARPHLSAWPHGGMVSVANPYASKAAADVLRRGGHAVEAAIAAHTVLSLVEPQSSGIGGGAFMLVFDRAANKLTAYNGREKAPQSATAELFKATDGSTIGFREAWQGGLSTGVPGSVSLYKAAHDDFGVLPWASNFEAAIELATQGFEVSPRLAGFLPRIAAFGRLDENAGSAAYFYPDGKALTAGSIRDNPDYAETLKAIAAQGPDAFYTGAIAQAIVEATQSDPLPGSLSLDDLANYKATRGEAICYDTQGDRLCTVTPPSSGLAAIAMVALYDLLVPANMDEDNSKTLSLQALVDAQRLAYADRDHYIGDPAFGPIPSDDLLNPAYLARRAEQRFEPTASPTAGDPGAVLRNQPMLGLFAEDRPTEINSTTHLSIVDQQGNAVSMTASVEAPFGNSRFVKGFLLNNQLTDFRRDADGLAHANAPAAGKQPRSSMSPLMAFDQNGALRLVTGSPGGNSIVAYVAKSVVASLRWGLSDADAVAWPNIVARGAKVRVETANETGKEVAAKLRELGYDVQEREGENSGLHQISVTSDGLTGAADPRREGTVIAVP